MKKALNNQLQGKNNWEGNVNSMPRPILKGTPFVHLYNFRQTCLLHFYLLNPRYLQRSAHILCNFHGYYQVVHPLILTSASYREVETL